MTQVSPFSVKNNTLYVKGTPVTFRYKLGNFASFLEVDGIAIVVLYVHGIELIETLDYRRNVYALDKNGHIIWRIQPTTTTEQGIEKETFIGVAIERGFLSVATHRCDGFGYQGVYKLNLKDGTIQFHSWDK